MKETTSPPSPPEPTQRNNKDAPAQDSTTTGDGAESSTSQLSKMPVELTSSTSSLLVVPSTMSVVTVDKTTGQRLQILIQKTFDQATKDVTAGGRGTHWAWTGIDGSGKRATLIVKIEDISHLTIEPFNGTQENTD